LFDFVEIIFYLNMINLAKLKKAQRDVLNWSSTGERKEREKPSWALALSRMNPTPNECKLTVQAFPTGLATLPSVQAQLVSLLFPSNPVWLPVVA